MVIKYCYVFLLFIVYDGMSQNSSREFEFVLNTGLGSKSKISSLNGNYPVQSGHLPAIQIGLDYWHPLKRNLFISAGFRVSMIGSKISTDYPIKELADNYPYNQIVLKNKEYVFLLSIPVNLEYQIRHIKTTSFSVQSGLKLNYSLMSESYGIGYVFSKPNVEQITAFEQSTHLNNNGLPWISLQLGGSIRWRLKNSGPIRIGILADISFSKVVRGTYTVLIPGRLDTYGEFSNNLSSLNLVFGYGLHGRIKQSAKVSVVNTSGEIDNTEALVKKRSMTMRFEKTHFSIGFSALYNFPAKVITNTGENLMGANAMPGVGVSAGFTIPLSKHYSIITGLNASMLGRNFSLSLDKDRFTPNLQESINLKGRKTLVNDFMIGIPIGLERRIIVRPDAYFSIDAGYKLNYYTGADIEIQEVFGKQSEDTAISVAFLQTENESKLIGNAFLNVGYNKILKNNNTVRIAIESNFAFRHHQTGEFSIYIADDTISTGTYSASGSYIGLGFTYIYSRPKRKVIYNRR